MEPTAITPRRAGVSSFGIGGTNAHVVLEEAPLRVARCPRRAPRHLLVLSRPAPAALDAADARARRPPRAHPDARARGRRLHPAGRPARGFPTAARRRVDAGEAVAACSAEPELLLVTDRLTPADGARRGVPVPRPGRAVPGMGASSTNEPVFSAGAGRCARSCARLGIDLREVVSPRDGRSGTAAAELDVPRWRSRRCSRSSTRSRGCG